MDTRRSRATSRHDRTTVLAIAMVAYLLAKIVHEGLGHGSLCLLTGGELVAVASAWCDCERAPDTSAWALRAIKAAGPLANLALGGGALLALRWVHGRAAGAYALWLIAAVNLFMGAGYMLTDPWFGFGDWTAFIEGLERPLLWKIGISSLGLLIVCGAIRALVPWLGAGEQRVRNGRVLALLPWGVVGGAVMTAVAMTNTYGPKYAFTSALATVWGTSFLAWMFHVKRPPARAEPLLVTPSPAWRAVGLVALLLAIVLGHSVPLGWSLR